jgi:putative nucleotidyltransferase with HDIG domain
MTEPSATPDARLDPLPVLKSLAGLRRLAGTYPPGHPMIGQKLKELDDYVRQHLRVVSELHIDVVRGVVHLDGVPFDNADQAGTQVVHELAELGIDSLYIREGVRAEEYLALAEFLWQPRDSDESVEAQLASREVRHISVGRLLPLDTSWRVQQWPDEPTGPIDPDYAQSLQMTRQTFENTAAGKPLDMMTVRDLVELLICKVARSNAALGQILAVKQYENLTYCHSVNVAMLSLLLGRQIGVDDGAMPALVEAALLHDIGKTRIPLEIVKKPGGLTRRERATIEAHTIYGAEILMQTDGLRPLSPIVALEHHRGVDGSGYPDLGGRPPHIMSQLVSVADIYEALTGARSYQDPMLPERACLVLARLAGKKLNTLLVKSFVNDITFFPLGSLVRTSRGDVGVVVRTRHEEPLHPVLTLMTDDLQSPRGEIDTSLRDASGSYACHVLETVRPPEGFDAGAYLSAA